MKSDVSRVAEITFARASDRDSRSPSSVLLGVDPARLSLDESRHTILLRLLQEGGLDAVQWLRQNAADDEIRTLLIRRRGRGIDPKRLRFWALMLNLPDSQVDEWIAAQQSSPWARRTG